MGKHALLSASSSLRWLNCTPSARLETQFTDTASIYAAEGTAAHALAEHKLKRALKRRSRRPVSDYDCDEMMLAVLSSFAQEESRSMSENNKWTIRKKFEQGEVMINTERFLGYDKDEYGGLSINVKEALIVAFLFDMTLFGLGSSRLKNLLNDLGVKSVTGGEWHEGSIGGVLKNEKYKGDCHLQKTFTPENKRNQTRQNRGEVQSYYITDNHPAIVSADIWGRVQEERKRRKKERNIGSDGTAKYQNRYPLSGMLVCPYCGKNLRRWQVHKKRIQWWCSTYIEKGKQACRGIRVEDTEVQKQSITALG